MSRRTSRTATCRRSRTSATQVVSADPGAHVRVPAAELGVGRVLDERGGQRPRHGCPMADPAMRAGDRLRDRQGRRSTPGSSAAPSRSPTRTSRPEPGSTRTRRRRRSTRRRRRAILEEAGWTDSDGDGIREKDGLKAKIELCTTTRQVRIDTLALIADWLKDVGHRRRRRTRSTRRRSSRPTTSPRATRRARSTRDNFDLAEHAFTSSIDPLGNYFNYHSSQLEPDGANDAQVDDAADRRGDGRGQEQRRLQRHQGRDGRVPEALRREDRRDPAVLPPERRPPRRRRPATSSATRPRPGPTWNAVDWYVKE